MPTLLASLPSVLLVVLCAGAASAQAVNSYESSGGRPMLGIEMSLVPLSVQAQQGLPIGQGVLVRQVFPNTAAANMPLQPGDVVLSINGAPIDGMTSLRTEVGYNNIGDPIEVVVRRNGQNQVLTGSLQQWPKGIPFDPLDPSVESRFLEWQKRRLQRNQSEIDSMREQLAAARSELDKAPERRSLRDERAVQEALSYLKLLPAWRLAVDYDLDSAELPVAAQPVAKAIDTTPAAASSEPAWRIGYDLDSTQRTF